MNYRAKTKRFLLLVVILAVYVLIHQNVTVIIGGNLTFGHVFLGSMAITFAILFRMFPSSRPARWLTS